MGKKFKSSGFTQAGTNHGSDERNNQDATASGSNARFEVIVLADGVSSCKKGGEGARITAETIKNWFLDMGERLMDISDEERKDVISSVMTSALEKQARQDGLDIKEYSSTLATILIDKKLKRTMYASVGDSLLLGIVGDKVSIVAMPADSRNGIPTTTDQSKFIKTGVLEAKNGELVASSFIACSDGAWKELYRRNKLRSEVKEMILGRDYSDLSEYLKSRNTFDDCTFITLDTEREIEKGEQTPLEAKRSEKAQLEDEARKISKTEKAIDRIETKKDLLE